MSRRTVFTALLSHWRRHPLQFVMLVVGLALATGLWTGVQAINAEARASYAEAQSVLGRNQLARITSETGAPLPQTLFPALREAGWQVSPVLEGRFFIGDEQLDLLGVDPQSLPAESGLDIFPTGGAAMLMGLAPPEILFASPDTIARLDPAAIDRYEMQLRSATGLAAGVVLAEIRIARRILEAQGEISYFLLHNAQPDDRLPLHEVASGLRVESAEMASELDRLTASFHLNLTAFGLLAFVVGLFIVHSAVGLAFEQRRSLFRTLRALGVPASTVLWLVMAELVLLALLAGLAGVAMGYLVALALMPDVSGTLNSLFGTNVPGQLRLRPQWWAAGIAIALLGALAAGARGMWRLARLPLLAPAQPRAWALASESALVGQALAAGALAVLALILGVVGVGLLGGFILLAAMLLAAALALPVLLSLALRAARPFVRSVLGEWFVADTRQQVPGLSLALMALMLALAANLGVSTMVSSFRLTFTGWLDQRLAAELYVTAQSELQGEELRAWLEPRVDAVLPIWRVERQIHGLPATIFGVADHATYRDHWPLLQAVPNVWDHVASGAGLLVNEQFYRGEGLGLGDPITLPGGGDALPVLGVYSDYGNPSAQVMIGIDQFNQRYPDAPRLQHGIRIAPDRIAALRVDLLREFDLSGGNVTDQSEAKQASLDIFERTFTVTAALNVLTLGVAGLALLASLTTLSGMRLPQLAPVWAMGLTRARLARLELLRTLALAGLTALVALPVGLGLAWVLLSVINVAAFGWQLPMYLFPADWLRLGVLALLAALAASALPVLRIARIAPSELVRTFAAER